MSGKSSTCPDCGSDFHPIRLIDQVGKWPHPDQEYLFTGKFDSKGKVLGKMCPDCGRIVLFSEQQ